MAIYSCKVVDKSGRTSVMVREAVSEEVLIRELNRENVFPLEVQPAPEGAAAKAEHSTKLPAAAVLEFTNTIGMLLSAGITLKDALDIGQSIFAKGVVNKMVVHLLEEIRKGKSLTDALEGHATFFPPIFRGFVRIGEKLGTLEGAFKQLGEYLTEQKKLRDKLVGALTYPMLVLSVAGVGIIGLVTFVMPKIGAAFQEIGTGIPSNLTHSMALMRAAVFLLAGLVAAVAVGITVLMRMKKTRPALARLWDRFTMKVPMAGTIIHLKEMLNFTFSMQTLTAGGYTIADALGETATLASNAAVREGLQRARDRVMRGDSLSAAFLDDPIFAGKVGRWIAVGERSGQIEPVFAQLHRFYQNEMDKWTTRFMALVEPVLMLVVGLVIFGVVFFFVTPIFSLYQGLSQ
jgi:type II secretory pathway component PulF